jgi:hypothetical protein
MDARASGSVRATLRVQVGDVVLEATQDGSARTLEWTGHGGSLTADDRIALRALERKLAATLQPAQHRLAMHEDMLYRRVLYWSDAPVGLELPTRKLSYTPPRTGVRELPDGATLSKTCVETVGTSGEAVIACDEGNEDGVLYTGCSGSHLACHDADNHCLDCGGVVVGPANACVGRCGGGCCVPDGLGIYTYDCLDHDTCCGIHGGCFNPWDSECGDEYWEADDDFWLASPNCPWSC